MDPIGGSAARQAMKYPKERKSRPHFKSGPRILKNLFVGLLFFFNQAFAQTGEPWELKSNSEGVQIFTRDIAGSKIKALKVECELEATLSQMVAVMLDVKGSEKWLYHTSSNYIVKQVSPSEMYYYSRVELPWPLTDRDFVAHLKVSQHPVTRVVTIDAPCVPDMVPVDPKRVRVSNSNGIWLFTPAGSNKVKVVYTLHTDPGGSIPAWLINLFVTQGPSQSFKKLKEHIQNPVYRNAKYSFIVN